ncbi:MAG: enoyl-CoA hydratase-related protein, partial [Gammaproteobacteria bacterium]|nr:enoyl-CoA hydratase-related protein [Gammaproteobacteria bacterium]
MTENQYEDILVGIADDVCTITLNRPHRLNAWTGRMSAELYDAIDAANGNPSVGAIVLTGAGRGFCAGADIKDSFKARLDDSGDRVAMRGDWIELVRSSKPLIAAVNGACVGVGATMILPMDVIVASDQARFGMAFVKMGVTPELGSSHFLVARVGFGRASEMCLTGRL